MNHNNAPIIVVFTLIILSIVLCYSSVHAGEIRLQVSNGYSSLVVVDGYMPYYHHNQHYRHHYVRPMYVRHQHINRSYRCHCVRSDVYCDRSGGQRYANKNPRRITQQERDMLDQYEIRKRKRDLINQLLYDESMRYDN